MADAGINPPSGPTIYGDRLTIRLAAKVAAHRLAGRLPSGTRLRLLDRPPSRGSERRAARFLAALSIATAEEPFFAGHLRSPSGESVPAVARKAAFRLADRAAALLLERSPLLQDVNRRWPRNTVRLYLAKQSWVQAEQVLLRVLTVEALARANPSPPSLYLTWPASLPPELARELPARVDVVPAGLALPNWKSGRWSAALWAARQRVRRRSVAAAAALPDGSPPALLVPQEDDLSRDRSLRSQPHWAGSDTPPFRTIVLRVGRHFDNHLTTEDAAAARIEIAELADVVAARVDTPVESDLGRHFRALCSAGILTNRRSDSFAANETARLVSTARELARFAIARNVRAFVTCENYLLHADAMQLVAPELGIRTLSYQYSNMPNPSIAMVTTADRFVTFAPAFHSRFTWPGYPPPAFVDAGYVYDSSFALVDARARERRARLGAAGATFVLGFFDESVQHDKYGWIHATDYAQELETLLAFVDTNPSVGLIVKTQFHQNLRGASKALGDLLDSAVASGRVELPAAGRHRNVVLPCEVARSCDITIGHAFGGTASLEAALAGCRSVLINNCDLKSEADDIYARADIVVGSMADALDAIAVFRSGARPRLGDWSSILPEFDAFRDGRSADRLRALMEEAVCT